MGGGDDEVGGDGGRWDPPHRLVPPTPPNSPATSVRNPSATSSMDASTSAQGIKLQQTSYEKIPPTEMLETIPNVIRGLDVNSDDDVPCAPKYVLTHLHLLTLLLQNI